jgi:hypothetical protein
MLDGADDPFTAYDARKNSSEGGIWIDDDAWSEGDLTPRPWVAPGYALRGAVSVLAGPPSAMKSSLMLAWGTAVALGRPHGDFRPGEAAAVILYNVEDGRDEQRRRLSAALRQFDALPAEVAGRLIRVGPSGVGTLFARDTHTGEFSNSAVMLQLRSLIRERQPAMLIADPLAELHNADENDNTAIRAVIAEFRTLAAEFNISVVLAHHTRKGTVNPGDPDTARGASAIIGGARIVFTIVGMAEDAAAALGIAEDQKSRSRYVRLDSAKQNYASLGSTHWYEKVLYLLDNGETVPAAVPWQAPDMWQSIPPSIANRILDDIAAGLDDGKRLYSAAPNSTALGAWHIVLRHVPSLTEKQARGVVATWRKNAVLLDTEYEDKAEGKKRRGVIPNAAKRPGAYSP